MALWHSLDFTADYCYILASITTEFRGTGMNLLIRFDDGGFLWERLDGNRFVPCERDVDFVE